MPRYHVRIVADTTTTIEVVADSEHLAKEMAARGEGTILWVEEEDWTVYHVDHVELVGGTSHDN